MEMSNQDAIEIVNSVKTIRKQVFNMSIGGIIMGVIALITFYFTANAQLQKHEDDIKRLEQVVDKKADQRDIQNLQKSLDEVKASNTQILNLLLQNRNER